jgi:hypothetical protein
VVRVPAPLAALAVAVTIAATAALIGCGAPEELSRAEGEALALARDRIEDAIDTEETLRTSPTQARRLRSKVRRIVSSGSLESEPLDEFGLAALGELRLAVPSLVPVDRRGSLRALDREALRAFLAYAERDARKALRRPAAAGVEAALDTLDESGSGPDSDVPVVRETASAYLTDLERSLRPIWPDLADDVADARADL